MAKIDQDVIRDGRKKALKDTDELEVTASLREQSLDRLVARLQEDSEGEKAVMQWRQANNRRSEWLSRQQMLLETFDEFIEPIYNATNDWSSTLHLPVVLTVCKTYHARMSAALMSVDPPFTVKARQAANVDRSNLVQELMRYTVQSWVNRNQGVDEATDRWLWSWVTAGSGVLKARWACEYTRYLDVVSEKKEVGAAIAPDAQGNLLRIPTHKNQEVEKEVVIETFNGPMLEFVPNEDVVVIGGDGDPQDADEVIHSTYYTASELWTLVDRGIFKEDAVKKIIEMGRNYRSSEPTSAIKQQASFESGMSGLDQPFEKDRYQILERHCRVDVDGSGIVSDVIMWVHARSNEICRATYLYRVMKTGLRPFFKIDFHKRQGADVGVGLPELLYTLGREIDAVHNMKVDFGLISSMPFGFFRATSSLTDQRMPLEPGVLIPLDNPQTDVFFPQLGNRTGFTAQEEQVLYQQIERVTSISDMSLGVISGQGAARTATGARALLGETNANLDIYLRRMNRGWKRALVYLFHMLQDKLPPGFQFRVLGDDGDLYWETVKDRKELAGMFDFEIEANSANSNKTIQIEQANSVLQTVANPFFIQIGIVQPNNIFEALKLKFQTEGVRDWSRFISKPKGAMRVYSPEEIANATLAGVEIKLGPEQDLQGFLDFFQHIVDHDELLGQFNQDQTVKLAKKAQEAQNMMQAAQAQTAQTANVQQQQMNASMAQPSPQGVGLGVAPMGAGSAPAAAGGLPNPQV